MVRDVVRKYHDDSVTVILVSGRDAAYREVTEAWLKENQVPWDHFYMRPEGDKRPDTMVKLEIFEAHIRGKYDVRFAIDDRKRVIRAFQSVGLKVLAATESIDDDF